MSRINVLWVIDHVCYDGSLHGGGRLYWNVLPRFDPERFRLVPCMLRADATIRRLFMNSPVPVRILDKGKFDPGTLWAFLRLIKEESIHVMHLHCYGASTFGRLAGVIAGVPAIIHDYDTEVYFPYPWYLGLADRLLAPLTRAAIAASPMVRDFLMRRRKIDGSRIHTLLHAVPTDKYAPVGSEKAREVRKRLGIESDTRVVATITKLGPQRGNEFLLKTAAEVLKALRGLRFLLVYKPTYFHRLPNRKYLPISRTESESRVAELENLVRELEIEENVRLIEWPENADELVAACDLIVVPLLSERFSSVSLLEAMAMGRPVIATDIGEQREIIENGRNGYLVSPGDVKELADRIVEVLSRPGELRRLSHGARATARRYSVDAYVERLESLYTELAAHGAGSRVPVGRRVG